MGFVWKFSLQAREVAVFGASQTRLSLGELGDWCI